MMICMSMSAKKVLTDMVVMLAQLLMIFKVPTDMVVMLAQLLLMTLTIQKLQQELATLTRTASPVGASQALDSYGDLQPLNILTEGGKQNANTTN